MRHKKLKDVSLVLSEALALSLVDRVKIRDAILNSIETEVKQRREALKEAESIAQPNGKN